MTDKERYQQLKKENDAKVATFIDAYHFIAHTYILKARGYAEASLDTEARIKDVLDELQDFCDKGMLAPMAIPNTTEYIEGKVKMLTKKSDKNKKVKTIIWNIAFFSFIASVVIFGLILRSKNVLAKPSNISHAIVEKEIHISWDRVPDAENGYTIYYIDERGVECEHTEVSQVSVEQDRVTHIYKLNPEKEYTFYIYANDVTTGVSEEMLYKYYRSEVAEYKYTPQPTNNE